MRRWDLVFVLIALVTASVWIDFSAIHRHQTADSLVMSLVSLYQWTPLFWEQNRLGMLVPALAMPFHDPLANLLVQSGLVTLSGLAGFFLLGYYVAGRRRGLAIGALGALLFVGAVRARQRFDYLIYVHQFATSLTLSLLALIALAEWQRRGGWWRPAAAVVLISLALWVNPSLVFALVPLILLRRFLLRDAAAEFDRLDDEGDKVATAEAARVRVVAGYPAADWIALLACAAGLLLSMAISRYASPVQEPYAFLPPREWAACALAVLLNLPDALHPGWLAAVALTAISGLATFAWPSGRGALCRSGCLVLGLMLPAAVQFAFITSLAHVHRTDYSRYIFAAIFLWQGACVLFAVVQWTAVLPDGPRMRRVPYVLLALFCLLTAARHGRPGIGVVRSSLDEAAGRYTAEVLAQRCTHVTGDYYHVWPTVFHANMLLAERGAPYTVWGIAQRCLPTAERWTQVPLAETRIAEIVGDEAPSRRALNHYGIAPLVVDHEGDGIRVLRPTVPLAETWAAQRR